MPLGFEANRAKLNGKPNSGSCRKPEKESDWRPSNGKISGKAETNLWFEHHLLKGMNPWIRICLIFLRQEDLSRAVHMQMSMLKKTGTRQKTGGLRENKQSSPHS